MTLWSIHDAEGRAVAKNVHEAHDGADAQPGAIALPGAMAQPRALGDWEAMSATGTIVEQIDDARAWALNTVDARRSAALAAVLGATPEIRALHDRKREQAAAFARGEAAPLLAAEAQATLRTLAEVAAAVTASVTAQDAVLAAIEADVMKTKAAIRAGESLAAVMAALRGEI